ncbi:sensor histidine kinase [Thermodesulfatator autotrophicus]|uniref:Histidine kinase domain-containing protein n=1 Tax=Thermodesulfatator autotrophicus TaxID=1795632 RepID=A0A177EAU6_9BACT|nr:ATP-binding protein [Thermodesulfatator autotrophicus]OAG28641.1 hypothetical protein TH606_00645 [Thermodesulfatator autotrophicus]
MDISLKTIRERLLTKKDLYDEYNFSKEQLYALWAFFDLAQEFASIKNFYRLCVLIPKEFFDHESFLYLVQGDNYVELVASSEKGLLEYPQKTNLPLKREYFREGNRHFFPFVGNRKLLNLIPAHKEKDLLGILEVKANNLSEQEKFFFQKYANRIGYSLHIKLLIDQILQHIRFVNELVADIEHNVIIPNIYYRYLFKQLRKKIDSLKEIKTILTDKDISDREKEMIENLYQELLSCYQQIEKHYENTSLFLESLLRQEHFREGRFVLRRRPCRFAKEIIEAQLERYRKRFEQAGIMIDNRLGGVPAEEEFVLAVDVGLLSQVYANLFSNVLKYAQEVTNEKGEKIKFISFGREVIPDYFGPGRDGIKFNVFSTGPHLSPEEAQKLFEEGWRGSNTNGKPGFGRGLYFVRKVIELHGGVVGYEPTPLGNNFYFILPLKTPPQIDKDSDKEIKCH